MRHGLAVALSVLGAGVLLSGCTGNRDLEEQLVAYKNESKLQLALLEKQSAFLTEKGTTVGDKMDALTEDTETLSAEFSIYLNRPDEIKREVYAYVTEESTAVAQDQALFSQQMDESIDRFRRSRNETLDARLGAMQATLDYHAEFMRFVFTYQDSVNAVFAARFDSRPWYQSVIGKWETQNTP